MEFSFAFVLFQFIAVSLESQTMNENLFVEERRRIILEQLSQNGRVAVNDLSSRLGVSAVTIRQDLRMLETEGVLERTYGGAIRKSENSKPLELSFHVRQKRATSEKEAIALIASRFVKDGFSVGLDGSTTAYAVVKHLKRLSKLTVVTNSLMIAQSFLDTPEVQVLMPGGKLRRDSISIVGKPEGLPDVNMNVVFLGTRGITLSNGITDVGEDEVAIKKAMIERAVSTIILADGSKWGQIAPFTFALPSQIARIITDKNAPANPLDEFRAVGVTVDVAR
jgi:DeoR family transcriptional regulator, fructose operon transcriptional repressor